MLSRLMTRREQLVLGFLGVSILAGAAALIASKRAESRPQAPVIESAPAPVEAAATPSEAGPPAAPPREVAVSIRGAVGSPGVYRLGEDSRIQDLIDAADGFRGADTSDINLAARLIDGTTLTVPALPEDPGAIQPDVINPAPYTISGQGALVSAAAPASAGPALININRATQSELETLPGIGPKLAGQIIQFREGRPFTTPDDLLEVPGIGPQRFEAIRELIRVD